MEMADVMERRLTAGAHSMEEADAKAIASEVVIEAV